MPPTSPLLPGSPASNRTRTRKLNPTRNTIRDALKLLIGRGLIETRPGQGTFVVEQFKPFMTTLSGDWQEDSGLGGGEGHAALAEVKARRRTGRGASEPRVRGQESVRLCGGPTAG